MPWHALECIHCRTPLSADGETLTCPSCGGRYPVVEGVPCILPSLPTDQQRSQAEYFDAEFSNYSHYAPERWRLSFARRIFEALQIDSGPGSYLDIGVGGSGATVIEAARKGVDAVGCDLSLEGVIRARRFAELEGVGRAGFVACAAEALPFPDGVFACASSVAVLEHIDDDNRAASELARVLRPGGLVWITVPNAYRHIPPLVRPVYRRHDVRLGHKRHYDDAELATVMERAGFVHIRTAYSGHPVKVAQLLVDRLLPDVRELRSRIWWNLEAADLRHEDRAERALQLSAVFRRS